MDDQNVSFNTKRNYLKRHSLQTATHSVPAGGSGNSYSVSHNLGYIPAARVFYEINGIMFEARGNVTTPLPAADGCYVSWRINTTTIGYSVGQGSGSAKTVKVHFLVYLDDLA